MTVTFFILKNTLVTFIMGLNIGVLAKKIADC